MIAVRLCVHYYYYLCHTGAVAKVNSHSIYGRPLATKYAYMDPKLKIVIEQELELDNKDRGKAMFVPYKHNHPYVQAKNIGGQFHYEMKNGK